MEKQLKENALVFDTQYDTMRNIINQGMNTIAYQKLMLGNVEMRLLYLKRDFNKKIEQSFLHFFYKEPEEDKSMINLCNQLIGAYNNYRNNLSIEYDERWEDLLEQMNALIFSYDFYN